MNTYIYLTFGLFFLVLSHARPAPMSPPVSSSYSDSEDEAYNVPTVPASPVASPQHSVPSTPLMPREAEARRAQGPPERVSSEESEEPDVFTFASPESRPGSSSTQSSNAESFGRLRTFGRSYSYIEATPRSSLGSSSSFASFHSRSAQTPLMSSTIEVSPSNTQQTANERPIYYDASTNRLTGTGPRFPRLNLSEGARSRRYTSRRPFLTRTTRAWSGEEFRRMLLPRNKCRPSR